MDGGRKKNNRIKIDYLISSWWILLSAHLSLRLLSTESGEFFAHFVVNLKVLGHTSIDANRFAFGQIALVVLGRYAFFMARICHSIQIDSNLLLPIYSSINSRVEILTWCINLASFRSQFRWQLGSVAGLELLRRSFLLYSI